MTEADPLLAGRRPGPSRRIARYVVQVVGFLIGLGLLGWCVRAALSEENREQLSRLTDADAGQVAMLFALSLATLVINGLLFWVTVRPVHKIPAIDHVAINALSTFLSFLPFKLGTLTRVAINNRRDRVPLLTITAWYGVMLVAIIVAYAPPILASLWRGSLDAWWWTVCLGGAVTGSLVMIVLGRLFEGQRGLARLHAIVDHSRVPLITRFSRTDHFARLHTAAAMSASPTATFGAVGLRLADLAVMSWRFVVAGAIVGISFGWEEAVLAASAYYLIGVASPFGMLGTREAGTVWMVGALGIAAAAGQTPEEVARSLTVLTLFITGTESIVLVAGAAAGLAWLRPDKLLRKTPPAEPLPPPPPEPGPSN